MGVSLRFLVVLILGSRILIKGPSSLDVGERGVGLRMLRLGFIGEGLLLVMPDFVSFLTWMKFSVDKSSFLKGVKFLT